MKYKMNRNYGLYKSYISKFKSERKCAKFEISKLFFCNYPRLK